MTDEELITALRMRAESELCRAAADRIEALVNEWSKDGEEILSLREKVEKLRGALAPFGAVLKDNYAQQPDDLQITAGHGQWDMRFSFRLGDFRRARAELSATTTEEPK